MPGFYGRYRCTKCKAIGLKRRLIEQYKGTYAIDPYKCGASREGKVCSAPAVAKDNGTWVCPTCRARRSKG
jgi:hypothetical protein